MAGRASTTAGKHPVNIPPVRPLYRFAATGLGASMWFFVGLSTTWCWQLEANNIIVDVSCKERRYFILPSTLSRISSLTSPQGLRCLDGSTHGNIEGIEMAIGILVYISEEGLSEDGRRRSIGSPKMHIVAS